MTEVWQGLEYLRPFLVPVSTLVASNGESAGDPDVVERALRERGQVRPVLIDADGVVVSRGYLLDAACRLGWSHIAARSLEAEEATVSRSQLSLVEVAEASGDREMVSTLARVSAREVDEVTLAGINASSADPASLWVGLPEFVPVDESVKLVVSCASVADREALLDVLGISTIHKGTRGTLSVWWPDRGKEDLASLRFEVDDELVEDVNDEIDELWG